MSYMNDNLWVESKQVAKSNGLVDNWLEIVEYYHSQGGHKAMVHSILEDTQRQILHILDDDSILLIDSDGALHIKDYQDVLSSKKLFFYKTTDNFKVEKVTLPSGYTYQGANSVNIKVV